MLNGGSINPHEPILQVLFPGPWQTPQSHAFFVGRLEQIAGVARREADLHALRGLLALESGAIEPARRAFRAVLAAWNDDSRSAALARHYLALISQASKR